MKILALESSATACSVALCEDEALIAQSFQNNGLTHSRTLMPMAVSLLDNCGTALDAVELIAVAAGPGSFTGLRIGVAAAKGLAWAAELPCAGCSTLEAMAWSLAGFQGEVCAAMDARRHQVYNARFRAAGGRLERLCPDRAVGLDALGFSGHSPLPFANDWAIDQSCLADYLREARSLQADFRGRFSLYCGLEWDSCSPLPEQKLDYLIGSVHYFPALPDGTRFTVDGSAQLLAQCAQVQFGGDMAAQADCYYALVASLAEVPQVDIVGHFDLITKFDEPHTRYPIVPPSARAAMERLIRAGKIFEINTGAISRGYRQTPYPAEPLLRLLREMDGKILFTADAHRACDVAFGYAEAVELACRCGFDTFWRLTEEGFVPAPLHRALT